MSVADSCSSDYSCNDKSGNNNDKVILTKNKYTTAILPLYNRDDERVPNYLKENPYILTGYRAGYTTCMCLKSFFHLHNESFNIWTHAIGFLVFVVLTVVLFTALMFPKENVFHSTVYMIFSFGCLICMACSTIYHLFGCHKNHLLALITEQLDYYGISILIVASFFPPLYIGFYCEPLFLYIYIMSISIFGVLTILVTSLPKLQDKKFHWIRLGMFVGMALSGFFPFIHNALLKPHNYETIQTVWGIVFMFFLYGVGTFFYTTRIPERWFPGDFDIFLSSHQIWHIFVLAAACVHFFTCMALHQQWALSQGAC